MQRIAMRKVAPDGMKAFGPLYEYVGSCAIEPELVDLVFLRVSQINGCAYCVDLHWGDALKKGADPRKVNSVMTWAEAPFFSGRERAALLWAESLTNIAQTRAPDEDFTEVKKQLSEKEIADLTIVISLMNAMNRIGVGTRLPIETEKAPA